MNLEKHQLCWQCGYHFSASTHAGQEDAEPAEDDISICFNCGALFVRHGSAWEPMTTIEAKELPPDDRALIDRLRADRARFVKTNLSKSGGRT